MASRGQSGGVGGFQQIDPAAAAASVASASGSGEDGDFPRAESAVSWLPAGFR
jgi:hypothetical protein